MFKTSLLILLVIILVAVSFYVGARWGQRTIGNFPAYHLTKAVELQESPGNLGRLPANTVIYEYVRRGEITTYLVFLNLNGNEILEPVKFDHSNTVSPLSAYRLDE